MRESSLRVADSVPIPTAVQIVRRVYSCTDYRLPVSSTVCGVWVSVCDVQLCARRRRTQCSVLSARWALRRDVQECIRAAPSPRAGSGPRAVPMPISSKMAPTARGPSRTPWTPWAPPPAPCPPASTPSPAAAAAPQAPTSPAARASDRAATVSAGSPRAMRRRRRRLRRRRRRAPPPAAPSL